MPVGYLGTPRLKSRLNSGTPQLACWVRCRDMFYVEMIANAGFDLLLIDAEHSPLTTGDIELMAIAAHGSPCDVMVRMNGIDQSTFKQVLDTGIQGLVVPMVNSPEDAREMVRWGSYPPRGDRGIGPHRAKNFTDDPWEYQRAANDEIVVLMPQIEHIRAVESLDEICNVPGVGGLFIGPSDLSLSMGLGGQYDHPDMVAAKQRILDASRRYSLPLGVATTGIDDAKQWIDEGAQMILVSSDNSLIASGVSQTLAQFGR
jgi:4-hydroxy-2-oxoheptanedioate aldolase